VASLPPAAPIAVNTTVLTPAGTVKSCSLDMG